MGWHVVPGAERAAREVVRWAQEPLGFELVTHDADLAARARAVFGPWRAAGAERTACRFAVGRAAALAGDERLASEAPSRAERSPGGTWHGREEVSGEQRSCGSADELLRWVELTAIQSFVPRTDGVLALHGALLDVAGRGVLVVGPAEAGKSSLACALWRDGAALLSDDVALLDLATAYARPGPRRVALRHASRSLLGEDLWRRIVAARASAPTDDGWCFHPAEIDGCPQPCGTRVRAIVFLERRGRATLGAACAARIAPAHAVLAWLPYLLGPRRIDPGDAIRRVSPLATGVAAWDLARGPLAEMAARVRAIVAEGA